MGSIRYLDTRAILSPIRACNTVSQVQQCRDLTQHDPTPSYRLVERGSMENTFSVAWHFISNTGWMQSVPQPKGIREYQLGNKTFSANGIFPRSTRYQNLEREGPFIESSCCPLILGYFPGPQSLRAPLLLHTDLTRLLGKLATQALVL